MNWHIIVNPKAGGGKANKVWEEVKEMLISYKIPYTFSFTQKAADAINLARKAVLDGKKNIISVGGDGSFSEVLNGVMSQNTVPSEEITLGQISVGTGNDWIKSHDIKKGYKDTLNLISNNKISFHDVGLLEYKNGESTKKRFFLNIAGFAFEGVVAKTIETMRKSKDLGVLTYILAIVSALFEYKHVDMRIQIDDNHPIEGPFFNVCGGNGKFFGGGMKMLPEALFDNGELEISLVKRIGKFEVVRNVPKLYTGKYITNNKVSIHRGKTLKISSAEPIWCEADGEPISESQDFTLSVMHKKIKVVSDKGN